MQEYETVVKEAKTEERTKALISEIKTEGENLVIDAVKTADKNPSVSVAGFSEALFTKGAKSKACIKVTYNKANTQKTSFQLLNGFVLKVMTIIYKADFEEVYNAVNDDFASLTAFNKRITKQLKASPNEFVSRL